MSRVALGLGGGELTDQEQIALLQRADELGYDSVWLGEAWGRDAITALTMFACHTSRIKLGTGILSVYSRTPGLIAQTIASLDAISGGRALLGLGTSGAIVIEQWHGLKYDRPLQRTREYIEIIRMALSGQRVNYQGEFFQLQRFQMGNRPVQERLPIYVASLGPRNLQLTGELADGWLPIYVHLDHLPRFIQQLEAGAQKAGRSIEDVTVAPYITCYVTDDVRQGRDLIRGQLAYYIGGMGSYYRQLMERYGYVEECQAIDDAWRQRDRGRAASLVTDHMVDKMAVVGGVGECRLRLEEYRAQGANLPVVRFPPGSTREMMRSTLEALAPGG